MDKQFARCNVTGLSCHKVELKIDVNELKKSFGQSKATECVRE